MKIRIAATLLALTLPLVAQDVEAKTTGSAVDATFYKAYYLEKGKRDFDGAMALYAAFLASAPEHKLAREAALQQFRLLDRTGKTKERDAFKAKYEKLLGDVATTAARPERRPDAARGGDAGGRPERGGRGQRGGSRRGGIMGMLRGDTKLAEMTKEQVEELKAGIDGAQSTIDRMRQFMGDEIADKLEKSAADMKKALEAGNMEDAQKALDSMKGAMPQMGRGRGGRGGEQGGGRGGRGGEQGGGRGGEQGGGRGGRGGEQGGGRGGRGGEGGGGGGGQ